METYECNVVLENGCVITYHIDAVDEYHAENKLQLKVEYEGFNNIYKIAIDKENVK